MRGREAGQRRDRYIETRDSASALPYPPACRRATLNREVNALCRPPKVPPAGIVYYARWRKARLVLGPKADRGLKKLLFPTRLRLVITAASPRAMTASAPFATLCLGKRVSAAWCIAPVGQPWTTGSIMSVGHISRFGPLEGNTLMSLSFSNTP